MTMRRPPWFMTAICFFVFIALATVQCNVSSPSYYGVRIGKFSTHFHEVRGEVYAVDDNTIFIKGFNYDGKGPDAYFWAGISVRPDDSGFVIPDEKGSFNGLTPYHDQDLVLRLPVGKEITELRWLSVWSKSLNVNFGSLIFPKNIQPPRPVVIGQLDSPSHGVSSGNITVLDTQTFLVPDFTYDGTGKNVYWWLSRGLKPNTGGIRLRDENGSELPLKQYPKKTVVISVPNGHSVSDYDSLSVWSDHDVRDYGFVKLPRDIVVPPSPRSLGISLENKLNCEMLNDDLGFEVRWVVSGDQLIMQLVSKIGSTEYMAFGLSNDDTETKFTSADATIAWLGPKGQGHVVDYFLTGTDKCENGRGMCPDSVYEGASNSITLMNTAKVNDYVMVTFRRPLKAADKRFDQHVYTDGPQAVLWAIGSVSENGEIGTPRLRTRGNLLLDFGREPIWNCPSPGSGISMPMNSNSTLIAERSVPHVNCPTDLTFRAQLGPTNNPEGGSQMMWYINGLPSPILTVQRGKTYTFLVEGGISPPLHHPLYITSSKDGGLYQKVIERKEHEEIVFAGVMQDPASGDLLATAEGRLCEWSSASSRGEPSSVTSSEIIGDLPLELSCKPGNPGKLEWLPDSNTSDVVYYQSFTRMNMGGSIRVVDWCEETDPEGYLIESENREKSPARSSKTPLELERESDSIETGEAQQPSEVVSPFYGEFQQIQEQEIIPQDVESEEFRLPEEELIEERIMNLQRGSQEKKRIDDFARIGAKETELDKTVARKTSYLHGEPEIVDVMRVKTVVNDEEPTIERKVFIEAHNVQNDAIKPNYRPLHLSDEPPVPKVPPHFKVQFEGGFVPLVRNPSKQNESPDFAPPPPFPSNQRGASQRPFPFDANESVPFHGTFKPGVPDFSGFNISHYTQAPDIAPLNHSPDQYQGLHSVPKPQLLQRPSNPGIGRPQELFVRPQRLLARPTLFAQGPRPQLFQPQRQNQHVIVQLPMKQRPELLNLGGGDLDEASSQRVQVALQSTGDEKLPQEDIAAKLVALAPPIQRRPDIVEEEDVGLHTSQSQSPYNYQLQRLPNSDTSQSSGQYNVVPHIRPQRPTFPFRHPLPMNQRHPVGFQRFPPGINPRPQFVSIPSGIGRPQQLNLPVRPGLFHTQPISSRPPPPQRSSAEESSAEHLKKFAADKIIALPSLEGVEGNYPKEDIIPLPLRENFGQHIRNRPQLIPASSPSRFPQQIFLQRPLNMDDNRDSHHYPKSIFVTAVANNDERFKPQEHQRPNIENSTSEAQVSSLSSSDGGEGDELDTEESQQSAVEAMQHPEYNFPDLPDGFHSTDAEGTDKDESDAHGEDNLSSNPEHSFEDYEEMPGSLVVTQDDYSAFSSDQEGLRDSSSEEDQTNIIENETNEPSIHLPDEHLGEDVPPSNPETIEDNQNKRLFFNTNRPSFFPVRRQPQFSSATSADESTVATKDPMERVKITTPPTVPPKMSAWPGRKNILPSDGIDGHRVSESVPSKRLEEIQLPEISRRPIVHDNGTDYSILTHVLSLIGGSSEQLDVIEPRTVT